MYTPYVELANGDEIFSTFKGDRVDAMREAIKIRDEELAYNNDVLQYGILKIN